jgi:pimeloyl-ACP methyl ester carboxylesterase
MAKPPLFFIHGMWSRAQVWDKFRIHFEALGYECHAPALPGHDVSPADPVPALLANATLQDYVAALEIEIKKCEPPPVIIGHSMGGLLAQLLAVRVQPAALVLLSTGPSSAIFAFGWSPLRTLWPIARHWGYWHRATLLEPAACRYGIFNTVPADEAEAEIKALVHDSGRVLFQMSMPWLDKSRGSFVDYAKLTMPSLLICGEADRIIPISVSRATARKLPGKTTWRELEGFGHWIIGQQGAPLVMQQIEALIVSLEAP